MIHPPAICPSRPQPDRRVKLIVAPLQSGLLSTHLFPDEAVLGILLVVSGSEEDVARGKVDLGDGDHGSGLGVTGAQPNLWLDGQEAAFPIVNTGA